MSHDLLSGIAGIIYFEPLSRIYSQKAFRKLVRWYGRLLVHELCDIVGGYEYEEWSFVLWIYIYTLFCYSLHKMVDFCKHHSQNRFMVWYTWANMQRLGTNGPLEYGIDPDVHPNDIRIQWMSSAPAANGFICSRIGFKYGLGYPDGIVFCLDELSCCLHDISRRFDKIVFGYTMY